MRKTFGILRLVPKKVMQSQTANFVRKTPVQLMQPTKRSPTCSRQLLTLMPDGINLHKVKEKKLPHVKSTGQRTTPSNHPLIIHIIFKKKLQIGAESFFFFYVNKSISQHIHLSADPWTSTASHDSQLRVDSSHQVIVDAIDSSLAANNSNVDNSGIQAIMPIISQPDHELINTMESNISLVLLKS